MTRALLAAVLTVVVMGMVSCAAMEIKPGAAKVLITRTEPKGCEYMGDVTGNQGNSFTGGFTSNANLETGARNDMKNKAYAMGGDTVVILTDRAGVTGSGSWHGGRGAFVSGSFSQQQTNVTMTGTVFNCKKQARG